MYKKILIANRADCALRLIRACHSLDIRAVTIAARDDILPAVRDAADEVIFTGMSREAYTHEDNILEAARQTGCEAILPGWGFLSEDFAFARRCRLMGVHFIGPTSQQLQRFGDKLKTLDSLGNLPNVITNPIRCDHPDLKALIEKKLRAPYMFKGRFGGGGKQIERFERLSDLFKAIERIRQTQSLSDYYVEPGISGASHIEFQCFGDGCGSAEILGIRNCTPQVHHQKWLELSVDEQFNPGLVRLGEMLKSRLGTMNYLGWGTVEFLVEPNGTTHLLELNPRLQVEHGVTELSRGIDIVRNAILLSCHGRPEQWNLGPTRESVEFRLYARTTGRIEEIGFDGVDWPDFPIPEDCECRVESAYRKGDDLNGIYDGMLARFILCSSKGSAYAKLRAWLKTFKLKGVGHNLNDLVFEPGFGPVS